MPHMSHAQPPLLVSVVAGAISTIGFGMSVAAIWLVWLLPTTKPVPPIISKKSKSRRKSAPPLIKSSVLDSPVVSPVPAILIPINAPPSENRLSRHVYFLDSQTRVNTSRRYTVTPETMHKQTEDAVEPARTSPTLAGFASASPHSSSSTISSIPTPPTPPPPPTTRPIDTPQTPLEEPEKLSRQSTLRGFRTFSKMMNRKNRHTPVDSVDSDLSHSDASTAPVRRANTITLPAWPRGRPRRNSDNESTCSTPRLPFRFPNIRAIPNISSNSSKDKEISPATAATTIFARRTHQRRPSGTAPRTQPYDYPYFATPPTLSSSEISVIQLKQGAEISRGRDPGLRSIYGQDSLRPQRPIHKRRSASTGWITNEVKC